MPLKRFIREFHVKEAVKKCLKEIGAYQHWPVQRGMGKPCLDCHGCYCGLYFAIETKAPGKVPTKLQEQTIAEIRAAGGLVFVIDNVESVHVIAESLKSYAANLGSVHAVFAGAIRRPRSTDPDA